tara:strand:+ start:2749 stop:2877 length:129 start_codon:yes stop_codon:yes gene_type:complete
MKCPKCKAEGFGLVEYKQKNMKVKPYTAVMQCQKCGHKEVFG